MLVLLHGILIAQEGRTDGSDLDGYGRLLVVWPEAGDWRSLGHPGPQGKSCHTKVGYALPRSGLSDCLSLPVKLETQRTPEHAHLNLIAPLGVEE